MIEQKEKTIDETASASDHRADFSNALRFFLTQKTEIGANPPPFHQYHLADLLAPFAIWFVVENKSGFCYGVNLGATFFPCGRMGFADQLYVRPLMVLNP